MEDLTDVGEQKKLKTVPESSLIEVKMFILKIVWNSSLMEAKFLPVMLKRFLKWKSLLKWVKSNLMMRIGKLWPASPTSRVVMSTRALG